MIDLPAHVEARIEERGLISDGQRILVAVSGGVDSMVLLETLNRLSPAHHWRLAIAHFNHQLRGQKSEADERLVRKTAHRLKLPFVAGKGNVRSFADQHGVSLEMAGRKLRHEFLAMTARQEKIPVVALAHHADDQVELFFLRLFRGAGGEGLAGMKWRNPSPSDAKIHLVRPLLDLSKSDLRNFAKENKVPFREDDSNQSTDIQRNRIRHKLIPLLTREYQPALVQTVLRAMELVGAEAELVAKIAEKATPQKFNRTPVALQRRLLQQQLRSHNVSFNFDLVERLRLHSGQWIAISVNGSVRRKADGLVELKETKEAEFNPDQQKLLLSADGGQTTFCGVKICWDFADNRRAGNACNGSLVEYFDADRIGRSICLRCWQPGDRFQPIGARSAKKLQDLFTNLKVPRGERRRRVVAATRDGEIFWVEGLRMAEKFKLSGSTARKLKWSWRRHAGLESS